MAPPIIMIEKDVMPRKNAIDVCRIIAKIIAIIFTLSEPKIAKEIKISQK
ncbi:hypothetical protein [Corynebacterium diphtheriae]|nr:hypothetical protein [Corynebacterium diphtheriae]